MPSIGTSVISSPTSGMPDFHQIVATAGPPGDSLLYIPVSDRPALSIDMIRIDRVARSPMALNMILQQWLANYRQYAGGSEVKVVARARSASDFLIHAAFSDHPIVGGHCTTWRYSRRPDHDYSIQFIRKLEALPPAEVEERLQFLAASDVSPQAFASVSPAWTEFAAGAHARSEQIRLLTAGAAQSKINEMPLEEIGSLLVEASPLHYPECWANLARFYGRNVLIDGRIDDFDNAIQCLKFALIALDDARADPFLERLLYDVAQNLAELLIYSYGGARTQNINRAVRLYQEFGAARSESEPESALKAEVMAGFGAVLNAPDSRKPLDAKFSDRAWATLRHKEQTLQAVDFLFAYASRMAYIARRKERPLYNDACLAADLAQLLLERAYLDGTFDFHDFLGKLVSAFKAQLECQLGFHGLTQEDLDRSAAAFRARNRQSPSSMPGLVFLRPLATSRRIHLKNRFEPYYATVLSQIVPETLTLESALHLAFMQYYRNEALGGPLDIFGMARSTAVGGVASEDLSWKAAASGLMQHSQVIIALFDDTDALLWEMSEISRLRAFGRLIFVSPPDSNLGESKDRLDRAAGKLREMGFDLRGGGTGPGFVLLNDSGSVAQALPFESLWSGELLRSVLARRKPA